MTAPASKPVVSVCIANYNGESVIEKCIDSLQNQKNAPPFEIIVHDDASSDNSVAIIQRYPDVTLISSGENVGFCISNNRMVARAAGDFVLLLNNDAELFDDALATLFANSTMRQHEAVLGLPQYDADSGELIDRGLKLDCFASPVPNLRETDDEVGMVIGACLWISRGLWDRIGGFPHWFETNAEDVYLCCYARILGHPVYVSRSSGFKHVVGASLGGGKSIRSRLSLIPKRRFFSERNRLFVQVLFFPGVVLMFLLPLTVLLLAFEGAALSIYLRRPSLLIEIYLRALVDVCRNLAFLMRQRAEVQRARIISYRQFFIGFTLMPQKFRLLLKYGLPSRNPA